MAGVAKNAINTVSDLVNRLKTTILNMVNTLIRSLNKVSFDMPDWLGGGHFGLNIPEIPTDFKRIPRLAQGTVLEGGSPFLAWVNDQPKGQTNVETPLSTMVEAFKSALGGGSGQNIIIEANGDFNQFIRFLNFKLKQEDARVGQSFVTGDAWI